MSFWERTKTVVSKPDNLRILGRLGATAGMTVAGIHDPFLQEGARDLADQFTTVLSRNQLRSYENPVAVTLVPLGLRAVAEGVGFDAHPDFFVSQGLDRQWQAWQRVGEGSGSVLLRRYQDNSWRPVRWPDRERAFAALNHLGLWSQGSPDGLAPESLGVTLRVKI